MNSFEAGLFSITIIDLLLSGDNALVIGMAVRGLPSGQKRQAVILGGTAALLLRVFLTAIASLLLQIPLLEAGGSLLLAWITYRLLSPSTEQAADGGDAPVLSFGAALRTIMIADVTMSLDNVLAVGAASHGDVLLLLIGLSLSMGIIMAGGTAVAWVLERLPWLIYVGAVVLLVVAGNLMAEDASVQALVGHPDWLGGAVSGVLALVVIGALAAGRTRARRRAAARAAARRTESEIVKV